MDTKILDRFRVKFRPSPAKICPGPGQVSEYVLVLYSFHKNLSLIERIPGVCGIRTAAAAALM